MVFYAYAKNAETDWSHRFIITAYSLEILDKWFRAIREKSKDVSRQTPEFYLFNASKISIWETCRPGGLTPDFINSVLFTLISDSWNGERHWPTFRNVHVVDHTSGNLFYIRSKSDPLRFWDTVDGRIFASPTGRTRFHVAIRDPKKKGEVMIESDSITISPVLNRNRFVTVDTDGSLVLSRNVSELDFSDFTDSFLVDWSEGSRILKDSQNGEVWELVS